MKYVVMATEEGKEEIFIFNRAIHHDCFAESVNGIRDQSYGRWNRVFRSPIAAGFYEDGKCIGRSETLDLESRGAIDEALINNSR